MLESLFSKQVAQPFTFHKMPIDTSYRKTEDKLFRQTTLSSTSENLRLRIIDHNYREHDVVYLKRIQIPQTNAKRIRVQAIANTNEYSINSSSWVYFDEYQALPAIDFNQFRVQSYAHNGLHSKWVYSSIRDKENDEILFNLLQDFLDVALSSYDHEIEYFMDYILGDYFIQQMKDYAPDLIRNLIVDEKKSYRYHELVHLLEDQKAFIEDEQLIRIKESFDMIDSQLSNEFMEVIKLNPVEFSELIRTYRLSDEYNSEKNDHAEALMYMFLDETLKNIVRKSNIEVLWSKDEEMGVLLQSTFDLHVSGDLIQEAYEASFSDTFTTLIKDAVQLLSVPDFIESFSYQKQESKDMELRMQLKGAWTARAVLDQILAEVEMEMLDEHHLKVSGGIVRITEVFDDHTVEHQLLNDMVDMLLLDPIEDDYYATFNETVSRIFYEHRVKLFLLYYPEEIISYLVDAKAVLSLIPSNLNLASESYATRINEHSDHHVKTHMKRISEKLHSALKEKIILDRELDNVINESLIIRPLDKLLVDFKRMYKLISDTATIGIKDVAKVTSVDEASIDEVLIIHRTDEVVSQMMYMKSFAADKKTIHFEEELEQYESGVSHLNDSIHARLQDDYDNLFFIGLRNTAHIKQVERLSVEHFSDLRDRFKLLTPSEDVNYALGQMDNKISIGKMRLGVNTLVSQGGV